MEGLAPPLKLCIEVRMGLEKGDTVRTTLKNYVQKFSEDPFSRLIATWLLRHEQKNSTKDLVTKEKSVYRRGILTLLERGLQGEPIYPQLVQLEEDILEASKSEIEEFYLTLPVKMLVPVLIFQFPAFLILLLGPMLSHFLQQIG